MKILLFAIILFSLSSCDKKKQEIKKILKEWEGKEIIFPESLQAKVYGKDTIVSDLLEKKYKIFLHVDSTGCSSCKLQLFSWLQLIKSYEKYSDRLSFIITVHAVNQKKMAIICKQNKFDYPVFYDINGKMEALNQFPRNEEFRCFLLDVNNQVVLVGNPINNPKLLNLYEDIFLKK